MNRSKALVWVRWVAGVALIALATVGVSDLPTINAVFLTLFAASFLAGAVIAHPLAVVFVPGSFFLTVWLMESRDGLPAGENASFHALIIGILLALFAGLGAAMSWGVGWLWRRLGITPRNRT